MSNGGGIPGIPGPYGGPDPGIPISQLPIIPIPLQGDEMVPIVQNGVTYRAPASQMGAGVVSPSLYYVATAGQTVFPLSALDKNGNTGSILINPHIAVYRNGARLAPDQTLTWGGFMITSATNSVTLASAAGSGDVVIMSWGDP